MLHVLQMIKGKPGKVNNWINDIEIIVWENYWYREYNKKKLSIENCNFQIPSERDLIKSLKYT